MRLHIKIIIYSYIRLDHIAMQKVERSNRKCYIAQITLTYKNDIGFKKGLRSLARLIVRYPTFRDYVFYPEYTVQGRLHFHGVIYYTNKLHYGTFITNWKHFYGFSSVTVIRKKIGDRENLLGWHFYCRKEQHHICGKIKRLHKYNTDYIINRQLVVRFKA